MHLLAHESVLDLLNRLVDVGHVVMPSALPVPGGLGGADPVDGPAPGHGHQPGAGTAPRLGVGAGRAPHLEEDLLENLLALGAVDDDLEDQRKQPRGPGVVDAGEGVGVTVGHLRDPLSL